MYSGVCIKFSFVPWKDMWETVTRVSFKENGNAEGSFKFSFYTKGQNTHAAGHRGVAQAEV